MRTLISLTISTALGLALVVDHPARAQPTSGAPPAATPAGDASQDENTKEARARFNKGLALMDQRAWTAAAAEFQASRKLHPTQSATYNAAFCLRTLQRYDEALEMFETMLREFPKLPPADKAEAQKAIEDLRALVGTVEITGAKPGATIVIDGRERDSYPPVNPLRVAAGTHTLRIRKVGFSDYETSFEVAGGQTVNIAAKLLVLTESGRLKVTEQTGKVVAVLVDGIVVGPTPWEGALAAGDHMVVLRGEGNLGTAPVSAPIKAQQLLPLSLRVEELDASLRIDPIPAGASVIIDAVPMGHGTWEGALRAGDHRVEVRAEGFITIKRQLNLTRGQQEHLSIALDRDGDAAIWKKPSKLTFDFDAGFAMLVPSFGGDVAGGCSSGCSRSVGVGALGLFHTGYEFGSGLSIGATLGYLAAFQQTERRASTLISVGLAPDRGLANDHLRLSGFVGGATVGYRLGEKFPVSLRLGAGVVISSVRDLRTGSFDAGMSKPFASDPVAYSQLTTYLYLDPTIRVSLYRGERFEVGVGAHGLALFAVSQPRFNTKLEVPGPGPSAATYPNESLTGPAMFLIVPELSARYAF